MHRPAHAAEMCVSVRLATDITDQTWPSLGIWALWTTNQTSESTCSNGYLFISRHVLFLYTCKHGIESRNTHVAATCSRFTCISETSPRRLFRQFPLLKINYLFRLNFNFWPYIYINQHFRSLVAGVGTLVSARSVLFWSRVCRFFKGVELKKVNLLFKRIEYRYICFYV